MDVSDTRYTVVFVFFSHLSTVPSDICGGVFFCYKCLTHLYVVLYAVRIICSRRYWADTVTFFCYYCCFFSQMLIVLNCFMSLWHSFVFFLHCFCFSVSFYCFIASFLELYLRLCLPLFHCFLRAFILVAVNLFCFTIHLTLFRLRRKV